MRWIALAANEIADVLLRVEPAHQASRLAKLADRYARTLVLTPKAVEAAIQRARQKLRTLAQALRLDLPPGAAGRP
jgi:hypothetical protein